MHLDRYFTAPSRVPRPRDRDEAELIDCQIADGERRLSELGSRAE